MYSLLIFSDYFAKIRYKRWYHEHQKSTLFLCKANFMGWLCRYSFCEFHQYSHLRFPLVVSSIHPYFSSVGYCDSNHHLETVLPHRKALQNNRNTGVFIRNGRNRQGLIPVGSFVNLIPALQRQICNILSLSERSPLQHFSDYS